MPSNVIPITPNAEAHAQAETERKRQLFAWADRVLQELGLTERVSRAAGLVELRRITFDPDDAELAVRDALHPASGAKKADHFDGLREGGLKRILKTRFDEMKAQREAELRGRGGTQQSATSDWTDELKFNEQGDIRAILSNLILFLRHHPQWRGVLAYDEFNARVVIRKRPPWGEEAPDDASWTDHHETLTRVWFQHEDIDAGLGDVGRAVQAAARSNAFHPVRDYLNALVWDRKPRLDTWLPTYFHAEDSAYVRAVGPRYLISGVARVFKPGCKVDHMLIFEGPQGKQKSEALRTLTVKEAWFTDRLSHIAGKDAAQEIAGVWLVEIAEMDALTKASASAMKAFLTRRFDRFRPPWARHLVRLQRQCIFAGQALQLLARLEDHALLNHTELAADFVVRDACEITRWLEFFQDHFIHSWHRRSMGVDSWCSGGFSTRKSPEPGQRRTGRWFVWYGDQPCRLTGEVDCLHFEGRYVGAKVLHRIGLHHPRDLLHFDFESYFAKALKFYSVDLERLGRYHDNRQTGRKRKVARIDSCGGFFTYNHDQRLGGLIYHHLAAHPDRPQVERVDRSLQRFLDSYGRGPFLRRLHVPALRVPTHYYVHGTKRHTSSEPSPPMPTSVAMPPQFHQPRPPLANRRFARTVDRGHDMSRAFVCGSSRCRSCPCERPFPRPPRLAGLSLIAAIR